MKVIVRNNSNNKFIYIPIKNIPFENYTITLVDDNYIERNMANLFIKDSNSLECYCDGGCIGNPGKGYFSYKIGNNEIYSEYVEGISTNNEMEWVAFISLLKELIDNNYDNININVDSNLVYGFITGAYKKSKSPNLIPLINKSKYLWKKFNNIQITKITGILMKKIIGH